MIVHKRAIVAEAYYLDGQTVRHQVIIAAEVYYLDGQTVRHQVMIGPEELVEAQIQQLEQTEALYRLRPTPLQSAASLN